MRDDQGYGDGQVPEAARPADDGAGQLGADGQNQSAQIGPVTAGPIADGPAQAGPEPTGSPPAGPDGADEGGQDAVLAGPAYPGPAYPGQVASDQTSDPADSETSGFGWPDPGPRAAGTGQQGGGYAGPGYAQAGIPAADGYEQPGDGPGGYGQPGDGPGGYGQPGGYGSGGLGPGGYGTGGYGTSGPGPGPGGYGPGGPGPGGYGPGGYGTGGPGPGGYGAGGYGPGGYGPGHLPQPGSRARRRRAVLTYLPVAVVAAAAGAGLTGYALSGSPSSVPTASGTHGSNGPNGTGGGTIGGGGIGGAAVRKAVSAVRPELVDISSNLAYQGSQAAATGMVISSDGLVLTNNHVIDGTTKLYATLLGTGHKYSAIWVGYDATDDIAVIKLVGAHNLPTVPLGDSGQVKVGDRVIAIGNAYGADRNPAFVGSITGLNRTITASDSGAVTKETLHGMLQTNAGIVEGDSGGPLVNASGKVIGMDTAAATGSLGATTQNVGFAIPINRALRIAHQIISGQSSPTVKIGSTGFMGVLVPSQAASEATNPAQQRQRQIRQDESVPGGGVPPATSACLPTDLTAGVPAKVAPVTSGALVIGQLCGTPADKAGIIAGDVITAVGDRAVTSPAQLTTVMSGFKPGMSVRVTWVEVDGASHTATLDLIPAPPH